MFFILVVEDKEVTKRRSSNIVILHLKVLIPYSALCKDRSDVLALIHDMCFKVKEVCGIYIPIVLSIASEFLAYALVVAEMHD